MRAFVGLRKLLTTNTALSRKIKSLEKKYDKQFKVVFEAIYNLMEPPAKEKRKIEFNRQL